MSQVNYPSAPAMGAYEVINSKTLVGNNAAIVVPIFTITGSVQVRALYGIVTTVLGANQTATSWRMNDQSATAAITLVAGTTISAAAVGSSIIKVANNGSALTLLNSNAGRFWETAANHMTFQEFQITAKNGATTNIEFLYTTTDTPTSGVIEFHVRFMPLSQDGNVVGL